MTKYLVTEIDDETHPPNIIKVDGSTLTSRYSNTVVDTLINDGNGYLFTGTIGGKDVKDMRIDCCFARLMAVAYEIGFIEGNFTMWEKR